MRTDRVLAKVAMTMLLLAPTLPASAADCTLEIFGNTNGDDTINMQDITYTELIILGFRGRTELADAKHDGRINMQDVTQIELIILGMERELTIVDDAGNVTVPQPITSFVYHGSNSYVYETLRVIDAADMIIGISHRFIDPLFTDPAIRPYSGAYYPELCGLTNIGILEMPDYGVVDVLGPDVVISDEGRYYNRTMTPGIPVVAMDVNITNFCEATMKFGYIFDRRGEAEEYIDWYNDLENKVSGLIEGVSEDEKPLVYISYYSPGTTSFQVPARDNYMAEMVRRAGGDYIGDEIDGSGMIEVDADWVITRNPDVIIFSAGANYASYDVSDPSDVIALIGDFTSRPEFAGVNAVMNESVYVVSHAFILCGGASGLIGTTYYAKWMYPDLFAGMDATEMHQEFLSLQHIDVQLDTDCYCVYPRTT